MEAIGSFFFILVLLVGVLCLFAKKTSLGVVLVAIALVFLYIIPFVFYDNYRDGYYGKYETNTGKALTIYQNDTYSLYDGSKLADTSTISFMNIDGGYIVFDGATPLSEKNGVISNSKDSTEIFHKISGN